MATAVYTCTLKGLHITRVVTCSYTGPGEGVGEEGGGEQGRAGKGGGDEMEMGWRERKGEKIGDVNGEWKER